MAVVSFLQLILLLLVSCIIGQAEKNVNRERRQAIGGNNREIGIPSRNSDGAMLSNNGQFGLSNNPNMVDSNDRNNQQQPNNNMLVSSQGQQAMARSRGFYNSPEYKPPSFSGEKPTGWFDTKYANWVSDQNSQLDTNNVMNGKNGAPSSLQGKSIQPKRDDNNGPALLQKLANHYSSNGEKTYNMDRFNDQRGFGSVCVNRQNFNGYTFGKFRCPLPPGTGMNQLDQYCCGPENFQYCCTAEEFRQSQNDLLNNNNYGKHRHPKYPHYSRRTRTTLAVILPIVCILVAVTAFIIIFLYYKKLQKTPKKPSGASTSNDKYSAVPRDAPLERPITSHDDRQETSAQA